MYKDFLPQKGNYRNLRCFQLAEHLYDITFVFCNRFLSSGDRTKDQMIQAARSIKQNIAEGSSASTMSTQSEMFLTNVGKSSMQELLLDYEDYLMVRGIQQWQIGNIKLENVRMTLRNKMPREYIISKANEWSDETTANVAITIIHQCDKMMAGLFESQKRRFLQEGGVMEAMSQARREYRENQNTQNNQRSPSPQSAQRSLNTQNIPLCPKCGKQMTLRRRKSDGSNFWGCFNFPNCNGMMQIN